MRAFIHPYASDILYTQGMPETSSTISRVFVGVGNALKKVPEGQDRWIREKIDRHIYPKLSVAQKDWYDHIKPKLEKTHALGYTATAVEGITVAVIAKKGIDWVRQKRLPTVAGQPMVSSSTSPSVESMSVPKDFADIYADSLLTYIFNPDLPRVMKHMDIDGIDADVITHMMINLRWKHTPESTLNYLNSFDVLNRQINTLEADAIGTQMLNASLEMYGLKDELRKGFFKAFDVWKAKGFPGIQQFMTFWKSSSPAERAGFFLYLQD